MSKGRLLCALIVMSAGCGPTLHQEVYNLNRDGVALLHQQDYAAAKRYFHEAVEVQPENVTSRYNLGNAAHSAGDWELAERCYRDCLQLDSGHAGARHGLALLLIQKSQVDEARLVIESWVAERPQLAAAHAEHGWLLRELGDLPAAQERLQYALHLNPNNARALAELGIIYDTYHHPDRAYVLYERSLKRDPHQPEIVARFVRLRRPGYQIEKDAERKGAPQTPADYLPREAMESPGW